MRLRFPAGLTGGIASGKSFASDCFQALGVHIIDTDLLAREVVATGSAGLAALVEAFGIAILDHDGTLNRRALRARVFADANERAKLDAITHPRIRALVQERVAATPTTAPYALVVVPLMAEKGRYPFLTEVIVVDCSVATQIQRLMRRDGVDALLAQQMLDAQASRAERLALADHVLSNDADTARLKIAVQTLHKRFLRN
jgi:dephospho-CoA kinase